MQETNDTAKTCKPKTNLNTLLANFDIDMVYNKLPDTAYVLSTILNNNKSLLTILSSFGGRTLRIPTRWSKQSSSKQSSKNTKIHELSNMISSQQMLNLVKHYGGTEVYIPKCSKYLNEIRNAHIVAAFCKDTRQGMSSSKAVQNLALQYQLSDRRIWSILKTAVNID